MSYARCSECEHAMRVETISNDVMMMWHGTHCGLGQAFFAAEDIFENVDDLEKKKRADPSRTVPAGTSRHVA
jgi:hypothetical protein